MGIQKAFQHTHRRVRPAALLIINDVYYLLAYDKRDHRKLFRVDRMSHVDLHTERFQYLPERLTPQLSRLAFASDNPYYTHPEEAIPITMRFHRDLVDDVLDKFGFAIHLLKDGDNHFTTTVTTEPTPEFLGWVFSLGVYAEILGPDSVRRKMYYRAWSEYRKYKPIKK